MDGVIKLLPDLVANQIAAGEVIQRPASAVKELMENAIDAGGNTIELWINDAGKKLIMVVDNGCGMSPADSKLCFERHATSKIKKADDLFKIRTLGFRGEALASVAAVAQLELKTRRKEDELGTLVRIEGGKLIKQEADTHPEGTTISVKNLFYNIPARRNFLKSNNLEYKHIIEEFTRVALSNTDITFKMYHDGKEIYHLPASNLKQRVVNLFGGQYNSRVVNLEQTTDIVKITGFIGKPEFAKKSRGEQYFFVNGRFFKHSYLHHAVMKAYSGLIPESHVPSYFIFMDVDPAQVDVNIHPTKTEVNFIESQSIYSILHTSVRNSLGKFNLTPSIEFEVEQSIPNYFRKDREIKIPGITINPDYNPFDPQPNAPAGKGGNIAGTFRPTGNQTSMTNQRGWEKLYEIAGPHEELTNGPTTAENEKRDLEPQAINQDPKLFQMHNTFIVSSIKSGLIVINQHHAHQRILFEKFIREMANGKQGSQQILFPLEHKLLPGEMAAFRDLEAHLISLGFMFDIADEQTIQFTGLPVAIPQEVIPGMIEALIDAWSEALVPENGSNASSKVAMILSKRLSVKTGVALSTAEMQSLIDQLFNTEQPEYSPSGKKIYIILPKEEVESRFI